MGWKTRIAAAVVVIVTAAAPLGCRKTEQAPTIPVSGKVTYEDGSLVPAERIELRFLSPGELVEEKSFPRAATARVDTKDGTFTEMTTWQFGDGVIAGEHEVEVVRYGSETDPGGFQARVYRGEQVWPSKVVVTAEKTEFNITIPRGP